MSSVRDTEGYYYFNMLLMCPFFFMSLPESLFSTEELQRCCAHGFSLIPMQRACHQRVQRVSLVEANPLCANAFLKCCLKGERLRLQKMREDARKELSRSEMKFTM